MSRELKVWGCSYQGIARMIVATTTKKEAAALFRVSAHYMNDFACITGNAHEIALAMASPGMVLHKKRRIDVGGEYLLGHPYDRAKD